MRTRNRPTSVLVLGILQIVFGLLGLLGNLCTGGIELAGGGGKMFGAPSAQGVPDVEAILRQRIPHYEVMLYGGLVLGLISGAVMIVSGSGLVGMRRWARGLTIGYAFYNIAMTIVGVVYAYLVTVPATRAIFAELRADPKLPAQAASVYSMTESIAVIAPIIQLVFLAYPVVLLIIMFSPTVRAAFRGESAGDGGGRFGRPDRDDERDALEDDDFDDRPDDGIQGGGHIRDR